MHAVHGRQQHLNIRVFGSAERLHLVKTPGRGYLVDTGATRQVGREQAARASQHVSRRLFLGRGRITVLVVATAGRYAQRSEQAQPAQGASAASRRTPMVLAEEQAGRGKCKTARRQKPTVVSVAFGHHSEWWSESTV
jgi:hypothetical protein